MIYKQAQLLTENMALVDQKYQFYVVQSYKIKFDLRTLHFFWK